MQSEKHIEKAYGRETKLNFRKEKKERKLKIRTQIFVLESLQIRNTYLVMQMSHKLKSDYCKN